MSWGCAWRVNSLDSNAPSETLSEMLCTVDPGESAPSERVLILKEITITVLALQIGGFSV